MGNILSLISEKPWIMVWLFLWIIPWKGWALWKAAKRGQVGWFVALLVVNSLAILEIAYIFFFSRKQSKKEEFLDAPEREIKMAHNPYKPKMTL